MMLNLKTHIPDKLPGRRRCECQARIHALIRNCQGCGRIVCEQEGSGPCVFCGKFVCTREEKNTIENDKSKGLSLENKLMKQAGFGSDMSRLKQEEEATKYRDMLLKADRESIVRNKVFDLDSDYYSIETANFLTDQEKKAIQKRKDELKRLSQSRANRKIVIDMDFEMGTVKEIKGNNHHEKYEDPEIQAILRAAEERQEKQKTASYKLRDPNLPTASKFNARYNAEISNSVVPPPDQFIFNDIFVDKDQNYTEVAKKCFFVAFSQPLASEIVSGQKWFASINEEISIEGPVYVVSTKNEESEKKLDEFSIIGKAILANCITMAEFKEEYPEINIQSNDTFMMIFEDPEPLETPLPFVASKPFGQLPKTMKEILSV